MLFRSLTLFSLLALTARSFLLPPSFQGDAVLDTVDTVVNTRLLKLDCPGCLFADNDGSGDGYRWDENVENSLVRFPGSGRFRDPSCAEWQTPLSSLTSLLITQVRRR
jgi:hypothetical protein